MPLSDDATLRFERSLVEAVGRFADHLRRHLAFAPMHPTSDDLEGEAEALWVEDARLRRQARRRSPAYDLNRHIAIRRRLALRGACPPGSG